MYKNGGRTKSPGYCFQFECPLECFSFYEKISGPSASFFPARAPAYFFSAEMDACTAFTAVRLAGMIQMRTVATQTLFASLEANESSHGAGVAPGRKGRRAGSTKVRACIFFSHKPPLCTLHAAPLRQALRAPGIIAAPSMPAERVEPDAEVRAAASLFSP